MIFNFGLVNVVYFHLHVLIGYYTNSLWQSNKPMGSSIRVSGTPHQKFYHGHQRRLCVLIVYLTSQPWHCLSLPRQRRLQLYRQLHQSHMLQRNQSPVPWEAGGASSINISTHRRIVQNYCFKYHI